MGSTQWPVPKDAPVMVAWERYKQTEEYANTRKWAQTEHVDGSLWAAFEEGFRAALPSAHAEGRREGLRDVALKLDAEAQKRRDKGDPFGMALLASMESDVWEMGDYTPEQAAEIRLAAGPGVTP